MKMRKTVIAVAVAASFIVIAPFTAQAGGVVCVVADPVWRSGHQTAETALRTAVDSMSSQVTNARTMTNEHLISAIRVATQQSGLNSEREANARTRSAEAVAQAYVEQRAAEQIRQAHETYGPQGQMVGSCAMIQQLQAAESAMNGRMDRAGTVLSGDAIDAMPGNATTPLEAAARRLQFDAPEAVSAVSFLDPGTSAAMRDAYMNNVIGLPFDRPATMDSAAEQLQFMSVRRWEALRSPAIASLAAVRASAETSTHGAYSESMSFTDALDWYIGQYGGGPAYEEWSAALVTKSETGLLKEISRLRAINLQLTSYRQDGADRRQAIIAALLAGAAVQ